MPATPDFDAIKLRQQATWSAADYAMIGVRLQIVGETLCEALDLRSGSKVLDVAAGNGNVSLAAARRFCEVTSTDYVPALLERGRRRAEAEGLRLLFQEADAENLPFHDAAFDYVVSTFGVMFAPRQERAAEEMLRVLKSGGKIGLANWTPEGFFGQMFQVTAKYAPPPAGLKPPTLWGTRERLQELFGAGAESIQAESRDFVSRFVSVAEWLRYFRQYLGPIQRAYAKVDAQAAAAMDADLTALAQRFNRSGNATMVAPGEYLEVVVVKR